MDETPNACPVEGAEFLAALGIPRARRRVIALARRSLALVLPANNQKLMSPATSNQNERHCIAGPLPCECESPRNTLVPVV
jgi:hypothetical protein